MPVKIQRRVKAEEQVRFLALLPRTTAAGNVWLFKSIGIK